jgi:hypothetical protein
MRYFGRVREIAFRLGGVHATGRFHRRHRQLEAFAQGLMRDGRLAAICGSKIALAAVMVISIADMRANSPRFADKYGSSR